MSNVDHLIRQIETAISATNQPFGNPCIPRRDAEEVIKLLRGIAIYRNALEDIHTTAHCIAKAGPLTTPTLDKAWVEFMRIGAMASNALWTTKQTPCYICGSLPGYPTDSKRICSVCGNQPRKTTNSKHVGPATFTTYERHPEVHLPGAFEALLPPRLRPVSA